MPEHDVALFVKLGIGMTILGVLVAIIGLGVIFRDVRRQPARGGVRMNDTYTAILKQSGVWWIGWIAEVPGVNCQERTKEKLKETLRITLQEALELYRQTAREAAGEGYEEEAIVL